MLLLAFDTATDVATAALLGEGDVLGERTSEPRRLLVALDELLREAGVERGELDALVAGTGPGSFTSTRIGLAVAQGLGIALGIPAAGVSPLDALASAGDDVVPVLDARRREVFVAGPTAIAPDDLELEAGTVCIGDGAVRYRATLEGKGAAIPPDEDPIHLPHARLHAALARDFGPAELIEPIYVRAPDAKARTAA